MAKSLRKRETGEQVDIESYLARVQSRFGEEWMLGWDKDGHELVVGKILVFTSVVCTDGIKKVLISHGRQRFGPSSSSSTEMGPIPDFMVQARYPKPTWIFVMNWHFNLL